VAERACVAAALLRPELLPEAGVASDDFHDPRLGQVWSELQALHAAEEAIDLGVVASSSRYPDLVLEVASAAPTGESRPRNATMIAVKPRPCPKPGRSWPTCPAASITPARPASAPEIAKTRNVIRFWENPAKFAALGASPNALIAKPKRVRRKTRVASTIARTAISAPA
jgi:hypothetical protein